ncbi:cysteine hydrolase family protein [Pseudoxanthomonas beigongshangi]
MSLALLVIDVQRGLFETSPPPADAEDVIAGINALARRARSRGVPVIHVQHERASGMEAESPAWQLDPRLEVDAADRRIRKSTPDSFLRTGLDEVLAFLGVQELVLCGYATEFCVDTTTRSAAAHGYAVTLAADAHTTHDKAHASAAQIRTHHNATLPDITSFGPRIRAVPADAIDFV